MRVDFFGSLSHADHTPMPGTSAALDRGGWHTLAIVTNAQSYTSVVAACFKLDSISIGMAKGIDEGFPGNPEKLFSDQRRQLGKRSLGNCLELHAVNGS